MGISQILTILVSISLFNLPVNAQAIFNGQTCGSLKAFNDISNDTIQLNNNIGETTPALAYKFKKLSQLGDMFLTNASENEENKTNLVPVVVFGFAGMVLGAGIGHSINHKEHMAGEFLEIFNKRDFNWRRYWFNDWRHNRLLFRQKPLAKAISIINELAKLK